MAAAWSPTTDGLVWLCENGNASNTVPTVDGIGRLSRVVPNDRATFDRFWAMNLAGGSFQAEPEADRLLRETYADADGFTLEAVLADGGEQPGVMHDVVSFGLAAGPAGRCNPFQRPPDACGRYGFVLGVRGRTTLFGIAGPDSAGYRVFDAGVLLAETPTHIVATFQAGRVAVYGNGKRTYADGPHFDLSSTADAKLRFGAPEPWNGTVDGVALYARALSAAEVAAHHYEFAGRELAAGDWKTGFRYERP